MDILNYDNHFIHNDEVINKRGNVATCKRNIESIQEGINRLAKT